MNSKITNSVTEPTSQHTVRGSKRKAVESIQNTVVKPKKAKPAPQPELQSTDYVLQSPNDEWNFKISTWNVAGLRAVVKKNGVNYLIAENPDIICLQVRVFFTSPFSKVR